MEFFFIGILVAAVFAFIAYPIFTPPRAENNSSPDALDALYAQRDSAYTALRDLDFDFQLGKLSENDYQTLRARYKTRAAITLQQIDAESGNGDANAEAARTSAEKSSTDDLIEREVARLRAAKQTQMQ